MARTASDRYRYIVRGRGLFPIDMLRYDSAWPASQMDVAALQDRMRGHSDCDGELLWDECEQIYPRLEEILDEWGDDTYDYAAGRMLVEAMKTAAVDECDLVFR